MNPKVVELVRCRYQCRLCGDIIESNGYLVECRCSAIAVDAMPGDPDLPRRMRGKKEDFISRCEWRTESGDLIREGESAADNPPGRT